MAKKVAVFTAGCPVCEDAVQLVNQLACPSCDVSVYDLRADGNAAAEAKAYGVTSVPTVVVDGRIVDCCARPAVNEAGLRAAGIGQPLA
ncbi:MAG: hypothetical protein AUJ92_01125 [Armatimonadetes bacterium CG2_30_59_28]|nr:hypothetical protein [Armatimonadota bacterium]OIO98575.1 MAG: hypothetical protein AUJ92_01125 [Armatimonadetes bacterium CG2_30_59_28]PIU64963.1 MAG: hypothetical protein COS85_10580 [Armatimonadetes bacterium CG07_land_8_20_14_0_80_59_28]PIY41461.1 MAG: hypothetical protein COZ05_15695 [Armatimonadetes bacterium CG_4_10_14_3_um_filter_59_10]PJB68129.1 MAG: hypothetical protein CO095_11470 [Armatimonadetes bacterium CG_4_9_14_3_um_filter_58_7]